MQWDLYRTFEAVARLGSLTAAARALSISQSTVSRHLSRLEAVSGSPLLLRQTPVRLTARGEAVLRAMRPMLDAALAAETALSRTPELRGQVTVTTVGELVRWVLAPALPGFFETHPLIRLRLLADNQITSLAAGEADIALRFARPDRGDLVTRRLLTGSYALYAHHSLALSPSTPWLGLAGSLDGIPEQRHAARIFADRLPRLLVEDVASLGLAVGAGLGVAVLPTPLAERLDGVVPVAPDQVGALDDRPMPDRGLWLVVHGSKRTLPTVRAVIDWIDGVFAAL